MQIGFSSVGESSILGLRLAASSTALAILQSQGGMFFYLLQNNSHILKLLMSQTQQQQPSFMHQNRRKLVLQAALMRLKTKNQDFLQHLESNAKWRKIYNGLLFHNMQIQLSKLINLQLCQARQSDEPSFFNPFEKTPITMCYNKFNKGQIFEQHAIYNLVLLYDSKTKKDMNWNNIQQTSRSTVRALHIAQICKRNDRECFQKELQKRVLQKQRFIGKTINFDQIYRSGVEDMSPISQIYQS